MRSTSSGRPQATPPARSGIAALLASLLLVAPALLGPLAAGSGCAGRASGVGADGKRRPRVVVRSGRIDTIHPVNFDLNSARLSPDSEPLLDEVADAVKAALKLVGKVRIEGHTDELGRPGYNQELSRKRAEVVRTYLIARGVPGERLEAVGHGEVKPMADNRTETGRAQNRRVEFILVK